MSTGIRLNSFEPLRQSVLYSTPGFLPKIARYLGGGRLLDTHRGSNVRPCCPDT